MNPEELRFAKTHEWVDVRADASGERIATLGLSAYAVEALTDLVFIELPEVGRQVSPGESFAEVESVKAVSDIYSPVVGEVVAVNEALPDALERFSEDAYGEGWIAKIKLTGDDGLSELLDFAAYQRLCEEEED